MKKKEILGRKWKSEKKEINMLFELITKQKNNTSADGIAKQPCIY